jgi:hypothetical protein
LDPFRCLSRRIWLALAPEKRIEFRIGVHLGDVVAEADGDLMGDGVNVASRLEGICEPGGVCLSEDAFRRAWAGDFARFLTRKGPLRRAFPYPSGPVARLMSNSPFGNVDKGMTKRHVCRDQTRVTSNDRSMIKIHITSDACWAIARDIPPERRLEALRSPKGGYFLWLDKLTLRALNAARGPSESYSDATLALARAAT